LSTNSCTFFCWPLARYDDDEIEDGEDHRQRNQHLKKAAAFRAHAKHASHPDFIMNREAGGQALMER
jgi:hypothetical protein